MSSSTGTNVRFAPFSSNVESPFWVRYCEEKLERIQLKEDPIPIYGSYCVGEEVGCHPRLQCQEQTISIDNSSRGNKNTITNERIIMTGSLIGYNTKEKFQKVDKNKLLWNFFLPNFMRKNVDDEAVVSSLTSFVLITYPELKNHKVLYWFGIPTLLTRPGKSIQVSKYKKLSQLWKEGRDDNNTPTSPPAKSYWWNALCEQIRNMRQKQLVKNENGHGVPPFFLKTNDSCVPLSLEAYTSVQKDKSEEEIVFGFFDPIGRNKNNDDNTMGWPMRNLVAYLCFHLNLGGKSVQILSYRPQRVWRIVNDDNNNNDNKRQQKQQEQKDDSILLQVLVPLKQDYQWERKKTKTENEISINDNSNDMNTNDENYEYKVVGWELNPKQKMGPRYINLRPLLDTNHLAIQAADLNLKLMKWRMIPQLRLEKLQSLKILMVGAGTLGCNVARILLGWGIRSFKIVDYGKVSYSNPVRQSLFTMDDCHSSSNNSQQQQQWKAIAAAKALHTIAPDVRSEGIILSIPMPGHVESLESITKSVTTLDSLVQECDVVYLLTDTRESRWLPTVMAATYNKMLINAALGLDSWLVMRHGAATPCDNNNNNNNNQNKLGCYFCNDVVAPENSTRNRTLDQQCTVTRPGLAPIASSMAVELMVSLLHHPQQQAAPGPGRSSSCGGEATFSPTIQNENDTATSTATTPLGVIPHQIRGSLVTYTMMVPTVPAFPYCTGCALPVIEAYKKDKIDFVHRICCDDATTTTSGGSMTINSSSLLENISGLTEFRLEAANKMADLIDEDNEDEDNIDDW